MMSSERLSQIAGGYEPDPTLRLTPTEAMIEEVRQGYGPVEIDSDGLPNLKVQGLRTEWTGEIQQELGNDSL